MRAGLRVGMLVAGTAAMLGLGGCAFQAYEQGQGITPKPGADVFQKTLVGEYKRLAKTAYGRANWSAAYHFSDKAVDAAEGREVLPDPVVDSSLSQASQDELTHSRERLLQALAVGGAKKDGELAGQTQGSFDCWLEREVNGVWPDQIRTCKARFMSGMAALEALFPPPPAPASVTPPAPTSRGPWTVLFPSGKSEITFEGQLEINKASAALQEDQKTRAEVTGHSDLPGSARANMFLSARRAAAVAETLELLGVAKTRIETRALGERQPVVKTSGPEPRNRRVEIRIVQ